MALSEADLQMALIRWSETQMGKYPELRWFHAVPNGGKRDSREAMGLKAQGVKAGVLDLHLPVARGGYHGFMIELKKPGGKCDAPRKEQGEYMEFLTEQGYCTMISNCFEELKAQLIAYLEGRLCRN